MPTSTAPPSARRGDDPARAVANVVQRKRRALLSAYRGRLREHDLEDCLSQAALELVIAARRPGRPFAGDEHIANTLEQKLRSRICDRQRAIAGRSAIEAALAEALPWGLSDEGGADVADQRTTERVALARLELKRLLDLARGLSPDQRRALAARVLLGMSAGDICNTCGWTAEKCRKVDQRGRARLLALANPGRGVMGSVRHGEPA